MPYLEDLHGLLPGFADSAACIGDCRAEEHPVSQVRSAEVWAWSEGVGVYYFRTDEEVLYVGRALPGTKFGARIWNHLRPGNDAWDSAIGGDDVFLGLLGVPPERWYLAAALELYLIEALGPTWNTRRG